MAAAVSLIGVPTDVGASTLGCRMGPAALRVAGIADHLTAAGAEVADAGDVLGPPNPREAPVNGYRNLAEVTTWNQAVHEATFAQLERSRLPIMLGGDHSMAIGSISAVARHCRQTGQRLRVLWFDAHADFNTAELSETGNIHGMPVAVLAGFGPPQLTSIGGQDPAIEPGWVRQIGLRSVDRDEKKFLVDQHVEVYDMRFLDEAGVRAVMDKALTGVDERTHLHVSLDLDFVDPQIAPGVGTPVAGGPTYREAHLCMEMVADTGRLGSLDLVELNPTLDVRNQTAELAVDLVDSLFGKSTLWRPPTSR